MVRLEPDCSASDDDFTIYDLFAGIDNKSDDDDKKPDHDAETNFLGYIDGSDARACEGFIFLGNSLAACLDCFWQHDGLGRE